MAVLITDLGNLSREPSKRVPRFHSVGKMDMDGIPGAKKPNHLHKGT